MMMQNATLQLTATNFKHWKFKIEDNRHSENSYIAIFGWNIIQCLVKFYLL